MFCLVDFGNPRLNAASTSIWFGIWYLVWLDAGITILGLVWLDAASTSTSTSTSVWFVGAKSPWLATKCMLHDMSNVDGKLSRCM